MKLPLSLLKILLLFAVIGIFVFSIIFGPGTVSDWLEIIKLISAIIALIFAIYGINEWYFSHVWKHKIDLAEETLALFYEIVDIIKYMRGPHHNLSETEDLKRHENENDIHYKLRRDAYVPIARYNKNLDVFARFKSIKYRFKSLFGNRSVKPFYDLESVLDQIKISSKNLERYWPKNNQTEKDRHISKKIVDESELIIWDHGEDDKINKKLKEILSEIEDVCRPIITGTGTFRNVLNSKITFSNRIKKTSE
jgi:hypothetical protein